MNRDLAHQPRPESRVENAQAIFQISDVSLAPMIEPLELKVFVCRGLDWARLFSRFNMRNEESDRVFEGGIVGFQTIPTIERLDPEPVRNEEGFLAFFAQLLFDGGKLSLCSVFVTKEPALTLPVYARQAIDGPIL